MAPTSNFDQSSWPSLPHGAAYISLNQPGRRNPLSLAVLEDLKQQILRHNTSTKSGRVMLLPPFKQARLAELEAALLSPRQSCYGWLVDAETWAAERAGLPNVLVLRSAGPVFCSGHDLKELQGLSNEDVQGTFALCAEVMSLLRRCPVPVVCVVQGLATAAGCQLALTTDFPVAVATTQFRLPGGQLGMPCSSPSTAVSRRLGTGFGFRMVALAEHVRADELPNGFVTVTADEAELEARVAEMVATLAEKRPPRPNAMAKWAYHTQANVEPRKGGDGYEDAVEWTGRVMAFHTRTKEGRELLDSFVKKSGHFSKL